MRTLHGTFEDAGMPGALRRLYARLRLEFARPFEALLPGGNLPEWIKTVDFEHAVAQCNADLCGTTCLVESMSLVRAQRRITQLLLALVDGATDCDAMPPEPLQPVRLPEDQDPQSLAATVRLCFGEMLEAYAAYRALLLTEATTLPSANASARVQTEFAQLCHDSYLAAVWTSAHAEYLTMVDDLYHDQYVACGWQVHHVRDTTSHSPPARTAVLIDTLAVPTPELHSVPCASNVVDLTALYERISCPSACAKSAQGLLAIFARVTNAGSRGWESTLNGALKDAEGVARICAHATDIALTGLHPCVHPAARRPWRLRFTIGRYWRSQSTAAFKELAKQCPSAVKEVMRLHLATLLNEDAATLEALAAARQPAGHLGIPPRCVAPGSLQASMHAFAAAGELFASDEEPRALAEIVSSLLSTEPRSRKRNASAAPVAPMDKASTSHAARLLLLGASSLSSGSKRRSSSANTSLAHASLVSDAQTAAEWHAGSALMLTRLAPASGSNGYCAAVPATMAGAASCSSVSIVSGLLAASFRAEFVPFWLHSQAHGVRASRLDGVQYRALHEQSSAHQLCMRLSDENRLRAYRLALRVPSSSLLTVQEAAALLGIHAEEATVANPESTADEEDAFATNGASDTKEAELAEESGSACLASSRIVQEAETFVLSLGATDAALMIEFARASALRAHLLTYDLGPRTRRAQATAICRRLLLPLAEGESPEEAALHRLPAHCTTLFVCSECRRVANACQNGEGKELPFNELGLSASMLYVDGDVTRGTMKCAKRSSAALRTALLLEQTADTLEVEGLAVDEQPEVPIDLRPSSVVQAVAEARPASTSAAKLVREAPASEVAKLRCVQHSSPGLNPVMHCCNLIQATFQKARHQKLHGPARAGHCVRRRAARVHSHPRPCHSRLWGVACALRVVRLPGQDFARLARWRRGLLHALRLWHAARQGRRRRGLCARTQAPTTRLSLLQQDADRRWYLQVEAGCRPRRHGRAECHRPAAAAQGVVLPGALAFLAAHGPPEYANERDLCAHLFEGTSHDRGRQGRWRR